MFGDRRIFYTKGTVPYQLSKRVTEKRSYFLVFSLLKRYFHERLDFMY